MNDLAVNPNKLLKLRSGHKSASTGLASARRLAKGETGLNHRSNTLFLLFRDSLLLGR